MRQFGGGSKLGEGFKMRALYFVVALVTAILPSSLLAEPAIVFDPKDGQVIYAEEPHRLWHPASLTKLMTAYVVFEELKKGTIKLKTKIRCSKNANAEPASKIGLAVGSKMSVDLALKALIVKSANDVAVMLAEAVGKGSEERFIRRMNATAKRLGMTRSRFVNPNGLPDRRQITTAHDMALLAQAIIHDFPEHAALFKLASVKIGRRKLRSYNSLLRTFEGADGMKTGFVCASGYNIVASATRSDKRLVSVVLGSRSSGARRLRAEKLLEHGFNTYIWKALFANQNLASLEVPPGKAKPPLNLRKKICDRRRAQVRKKVRRKKRKVRRKKKRKKSSG